MPKVRIVIGKFPSWYTPKEGIHDNKLLHFRRELRGISVSDHQPNVVPDDSRFGNPQGFGERMHTDSSRLHVEPSLGNIGFADAGQVGSNYGELIRELRNQRPQHSRSLRITMKKNDSRSVPGKEVVNLYPFNPREP